MVIYKEKRFNWLTVLRAVDGDALAQGGKPRGAHPLHPRRAGVSPALPRRNDERTVLRENQRRADRDDAEGRNGR